MYTYMSTEIMICDTLTYLTTPYLSLWPLLNFKNTLQIAENYLFQLQYAMALDIVNNLLLYVEPKKKVNSQYSTLT